MKCCITKCSVVGRLTSAEWEFWHFMYEKNWNVLWYDFCVSSFYPIVRKGVFKISASICIVVCEARRWARRVDAFSNSAMAPSRAGQGRIARSSIATKKDSPWCRDGRCAWEAETGLEATTSDGTEGQVPGRSQSAMRRIELRWDELYLSLQNEELAEYMFDEICERFFEKFCGIICRNFNYYLIILKNISLTRKCRKHLATISTCHEKRI